MVSLNPQRSPLPQEKGPGVPGSTISSVLAGTDGAESSWAEAEGQAKSSPPLPDRNHCCVMRESFCPSQTLFMVNLLPDSHKGKD